eukprot:24280-Eustigmatos_ZCMA.PRE.1
MFILYDSCGGRQGDSFLRLRPVSPSDADSPNSSMPLSPRRMSTRLALSKSNIHPQVGQRV